MYGGSAYTIELFGIIKSRYSCFSEQNLKENEEAYDNTIKIIYNDGKGNEAVVLENVECKIIDDNY